MTGTRHLAAIGFGIPFGVAGLLWLAAIVHEVTGIDAEDIVAWEIGSGMVAVLLWTLMTQLLVRLALLVGITALLVVVLVLAASGGNQEVLDLVLVKTGIVGVSVGLGILYLLWGVRDDS